jgi:hypothetical protein
VSACHYPPGRIQPRQRRVKRPAVHLGRLHKAIGDSALYLHALFWFPSARMFDKRWKLWVMWHSQCGPQTRSQANLACLTSVSTILSYKQDTVYPQDKQDGVSDLVL